MAGIKDETKGSPSGWSGVELEVEVHLYEMNINVLVCLFIPKHQNNHLLRQIDTDAQEMSRKDE